MPPVARDIRRNHRAVEGDRPYKGADGGSCQEMRLRISGCPQARHPTEATEGQKEKNSNAPPQRPRS